MVGHHTLHGHAHADHEPVVGHEPSGAAGHGSHDAGHGKHAGHDPEAFRRRFWLSLVLTIPLVITSEMVMEWFNYEVSFRGMDDPRFGGVLVGWLAVPDGIGR